MKRIFIGVSAAVLCAGLAACAGPKKSQELSEATVQYRCGPGGESPLSVQYTFQGTEPLAAKIMYQNQAVDLTRATGMNTDMLGNTFRGNGYTWTTEKFSLENVHQVNGGMLTQDVQQVVNGHQSQVSNILVKDCRVSS